MNVTGGYPAWLAVLFCMFIASLSPVYAAENAADDISAAPSLAGGDPAVGEQVYYRCIGCHSFDRNRTGPKHCGLLGRKAGAVEGYQYSTAMRESAIVWDVRSLDRFLQAPLSTIPGTTMGFAGVKGARARRDLIAYLRIKSSPEQCK